MATRIDLIVKGMSKWLYFLSHAVLQTGKYVEFGSEDKYLHV